MFLRAVYYQIKISHQVLPKFFATYHLSLFVKSLLNLPVTAANDAIQQGPIAGWGALGNVFESYFGYRWRPHQARPLLMLNSLGSL